MNSQEGTGVVTRRIAKISTHIGSATVFFQLDCGHVVEFKVAEHPVKTIDVTLRVGDEMDCDQCGVVH